MSEEIIDVVEPTKSSVSLKYINQIFMWWWISLILTLPTCGLAVFAVIVLSFILLFHYWELVPQGVSKVTPGKAVGFWFIPIFNIYWIFRAIGELGKILYNLTGKERPSIKIISIISCCTAAISTIFSIVSLCIYGVYVPQGVSLVSKFISIINIVFFIITFVKFQNAARQILKK